MAPPSPCPLFLALLALCLLPGGASASGLRTPPMGFSSWNHFSMRVSAPLLLDVADAFESTGLRAAGYIYINTDDGWLDKNRTAEGGKLHPAATFSNETDGIKALATALHGKNFKFGIYLAAGESTCGNRAGTLYHEFQDAAQIAAAGVDYLKYDDCGEANIQSYAKYHVMKDALAAAYGEKGVDYYSYEPFQVYNSVAVAEMGWTSTVGDLWRTGGDIRPSWKSILNNAHANNKWAPNARPGHYNDADMLEIGNGQLTLAEQRSHFALWCLMKSPLIIGSDVRGLPAESLAVLKNKWLIALNQDGLGIQGTLRAVMDQHGRSAVARPAAEGQESAAESPQTGPRAGSAFVGNCSFGTAPAEQQWQIVEGAGAAGARLVAVGGKSFLARGTGNEVVATAGCTASSTKGCGSAAEWDLGQANITVSQIRDPYNSSSCLAYDGSSLHMEACRVETGDAEKAANCSTSNCRFASLSDQLFYLNSLKQLSLAWTNFQAPIGDNPRHVATNIPMCLVTGGGLQQGPTARPPPPALDTSMPLQVWAGPLSGGDVAVLMLNTGNFSKSITAKWADIGLRAGLSAKAVDLWTGASAPTGRDSISATVPTHDVAAFRLTPAAEY